MHAILRSFRKRKSHDMASENDTRHGTRGIQRRRAPLQSMLLDATAVELSTVSSFSRPPVHGQQLLNSRVIDVGTRDENRRNEDLLRVRLARVTCGDGSHGLKAHGITDRKSP